MPFVQSVTATETTGTGTYTSSAFASSTTTGNLIVVTISDDSSSAAGTVTSVTDSKGNAYTQIGTGQEANTTGQTVVTMWYAKNITGGASHTITVNYNSASSNNNSFVAQEFSGVNTTAPLDVTTKSKGAGTAVSSGATATLTQAASLVVSGMTSDTVQAPTAGSGYTNLAQRGSGATTPTQAAQESKIVASTAAVTGTFTIASTNWACIVAVFKLSGTTTNQPLTASLSFTGRFSKLPTKALTAALSFSGAIRRAVTKHLTAATLSFVGAVTKRTTRTLSGGLSFTGSLAKATAFARVFTAGLSFSASLVQGRAYLRSFTASLSFTGTVSVAELIWTRIKTIVFGASKPLTTQSGNAFTAPPSGGTIETVISGTKNETTQTGKNNDAVKGGDTKETI